ncbi:MAG: hypothetical protein R3D44_14050, partial [Hyphomicrobiaceae bacterium]
MGILRSVPRVCALVGVWCWGGAWAETASPTGNTLHKLVAGRTIVLETGMGGIPIVYQADGGMKGSASGLPASMLEGPREDR